MVYVDDALSVCGGTELTRKFVEKLNAPKGKKVIYFDDSAHFPMHEEPNKFLEVLKSAASNL